MFNKMETKNMFQIYTLQINKYKFIIKKKLKKFFFILLFQDPSSHITFIIIY